MAPAISPDRKLLALGEALDAADVALHGGDTTLMLDETRDELTGKWMYIVSEMAKLRARTVRGRRTKAVVLQMLHERLQLEPSPFNDLSLSLSLDLVRPLQRGSR